MRWPIALFPSMFALALGALGCGGEDPGSSVEPVGESSAEVGPGNPPNTCRCQVWYMGYSTCYAKPPTRGSCSDPNWDLPLPNNYPATSCGAAYNDVHESPCGNYLADSFFGLWDPIPSQNGVCQGSYINCQPVYLGP